MHTKSDNIESKMNHEVDEVIEEIFESLKKDVKIGRINKGSEFVFDFVHLLYYKCHRIVVDRTQILLIA